jgi:hypothetical protein
MDSCKKFGVGYNCHSNYFVAAYHHVAELYVFLSVCATAV